LEGLLVKDPTFRFCDGCAKRTVHRKKRLTNRKAQELKTQYVWACATCDPREKGERR